MKTQNKSKGTLWETHGKNYLIGKGYHILETNFCFNQGEIDIIAKDEEYIVFVEVKYRAHANYGYPIEAVGHKKRQKLIMAANFYIQTNDIINSNFRFDVIQILGTKIEHIVNAFGA